jgi:hypothetical protein
MRVFHFSDRGRGAHGVTQGLLELGLTVLVDTGYVSLGREVLRPADPQQARDCDLVFCGVARHRPLIRHFRKLKDTIFYEYRDRCTPDPAFLGGRGYFKRSVTCGPDRKPAGGDSTPINYSALDEYYLAEGHERTYDIGCFFDPGNPKLGLRRGNVLRALQRLDPPNSLVGVSTGHSNSARLAICDPPLRNPFVDFIRLQHRTKVIFTAQPWLVDGDNRTWEAMASGALVFLDRCSIPTPDWPVDGQHCCHYDAADPASVDAAIGRALYYLKNDAGRERVAAAGYRFVRERHRAVNRVRYMLGRSRCLPIKFL